MLDLDCFGEEFMGLRNRVGIEVGKVIKNVSCVVMSVKVLVTNCRSVQHIVVVESIFS